MEGLHPPGISVSNERRILPSKPDRKPYSLLTLASIKPYLARCRHQVPFKPVMAHMQNASPQRCAVLGKHSSESCRTHAIEYLDNGIIQINAVSRGIHFGDAVLPAIFTPRLMFPCTYTSAAGRWSASAFSGPGESTLAGLGTKTAGLQESPQIRKAAAPTFCGRLPAEGISWQRSGQHIWHG